MNALFMYLAQKRKPHNTQRVTLYYEQTDTRSMGEVCFPGWRFEFSGRSELLAHQMYLAKHGWQVVTIHPHNRLKGWAATYYYEHA